MWSRPKLVQGALATLLVALLVALAACGDTSPSTGSSGLAGTSPRPTTSAAGGPSVTPVPTTRPAATGPWTAIEGPGYYKGTALTTSTKGATLLISQDGAFGLVILASTCGGCGTFTLRYPELECWVEEEEQAVGRPSLPPATCPPGSEPVELRGPRSDSAIAFMGNNGEEGYGGPLELVVTSSGKPVTIDGVIFADTE